MSFTVRIEPRIVTSYTAGDGPGEPVPRTVYDVHVYDGNGEGGEEQLIFTNQGYENRLDAVALAVRLFGSPDAIATYRGIAGGPFIAEPATLQVDDASGSAVLTSALR